MFSWKYEKLFKYDGDFLSKKSGEPDCTEVMLMSDTRKWVRANSNIYILRRRHKLEVDLMLGSVRYIMNPYLVHMFPNSIFNIVENEKLKVTPLNHI